MNRTPTREPQYGIVYDIAEKTGIARFGLMANQLWHEDPKKILFSMARYKFAAKMLSGAHQALEIGCGDGFFSRLVKQEVERLTVVDFDPVFIEEARQLRDDRWPYECLCHDILAGPVPGTFDAVYSLDVFEHIPPERETLFIRNILASLSPEGKLLVGIPSKTSQKFASASSRVGHVNCKDGPELRELFLRFFHQVHSFSMNDEIVHTGFPGMAHYLFVLASGQRALPAD